MENKSQEKDLCRFSQALLADRMRPLRARTLGRLWAVSVSILSMKWLPKGSWDGENKRQISKTMDGRRKTKHKNQSEAYFKFSNFKWSPLTDLLTRNCKLINKIKKEKKNINEIKVITNVLNSEMLLKNKLVKRKTTDEIIQNAAKRNKKMKNRRNYVTWRTE